jgi:uncharacterized Zn-binding protein involved in type VI secretion
MAGVEDNKGVAKSIPLSDTRFNKERDMPYSIEGKEVILLGDTTTHGGKVITASDTHKYMGTPIARVGDMVECPKCKGTYPIIEGAPKTFDHGKPIARHGDKTACGATLISRGNRTKTFADDSGPAWPEGTVYAAATTGVVSDASKKPLGTLSEKQAQELFDELKSNKDIPFGYASDCCYARAHRMASIMNVKGIKNQKLWCWPLGNDSLNAKKVWKPNDIQNIEWKYHVASTVGVVDARGNVKQKVIDPSLFDSPVSIDEWLGRMDTTGIGSPRNVFPSPNYIFFVIGSRTTIHFDNDGSKTEKSFKEHREKMDHGER